MSGPRKLRKVNSAVLISEATPMVTCMKKKNEETFAHFEAFYNSACQIYNICILFYMLPRVFLGRINLHILVSFHNIFDL